MAGYNNPNVLPISAATFENGTTTWAGVTNTPNPPTVVTTYALEGTHSLQLKATAAGTATIRSLRYAVTAGTNYFMWVPFRSVAGNAARVITATISWYSAQTGGTALSTAVTTSPAITASALTWDNKTALASNLFYAPTQYAIAPPGATYADITLSVSLMAANENIFFDGITLSVADPVSVGNLLTAVESYYETGTSGWVVAGAVSGRNAGLASTRTTVGQYSGVISASSAGTVTKTLARGVPVVAGTEYIYREAGVSPGTAPVTPQIKWYSASDALISTSSGPTVTPPANKSRGVVVVDTAPAGAVTAKPVLSIAAPAGYALLFDDAEFMPTSAANWPGNLLPYTDASFETSVPASLTATNGWVVGGQEAQTVFGYYEEGYYYAGVTPGAVGSTTRVMLGVDAPVTPGEVYEYGATLMAASSTPNAAMDVTHRPVVVWYDANHDALADEVLDAFTTHTLVTGAITDAAHFQTTYWSTRTAPESAAYAQVGYDVQHLTSDLTSYGLDNVRITPRALEYELSADDSQGVMNLVIHADSPAPASTWSVTRFSDSTGDASVVRHETGDLLNAPWTASPVIIEDYEAPMGDSYWYLIQWYTADGASAGRILTASVQGPSITDASYVWLKNPGVPATNTMVMMAAPPVWAREARQTLTNIVGRKTPISVFDVRGTRTSEITVYAWDSGAAAQIESLIDPGSVLLIQADPGYGLPGNLYVAIGDTQRDPVSDDATDEGWAYTLPITEVDRPVGGMRGTAGRTWQDILDGYATWLDVFQDFPDWQAVLLGED